jgi:hypothetical protein
MSTLQPRGESLRRAVRHIGARLQEPDPPSIASLVNDATLRFDLSPNEAEYLIRFYRDARACGNAGMEEEDR